MLEKKVQDKILDHLRKRFPTAVIWKLNDSVISSIPDIQFIYNGRVIFFEVKRNKKIKAKKLQEYTLKKLNKNNIPAHKVSSLEEVKNILEENSL